MKKLPIILLLSLASQSSYAATAQTAINTYSIDEGVAFTMGNDAAADYLFSWSDSSGATISIADPTLILTVGQTYTFERTSSQHPFAILNDSLALSFIGSELFRDTTDSSVINAAILSPSVDFTSNPTPAPTTITWTPTNAEIGDYLYTCLVASHTGMTGKIQVVPEPSSLLLGVMGAGFFVSRRKR